MQENRRIDIAWFRMESMFRTDLPIEAKTFAASCVGNSVCLKIVPLFSALDGSRRNKSASIIAFAREKLGEENFTAHLVPHDELADYYRAADLFVLASLQEGFGRVFLEALVHGLPVIAHDHPVMRFVLGSEGTFGDLSKPGGLATLIREKLGGEDSEADAIRRREMVQARFSWAVLAPQYREMFLDCFQKVNPA